MNRWVCVYHDGDAIRAKVLVDQVGTLLPFGVERFAGQIEPEREFQVNALIRVADHELPEVVVDDQEVVLEEVALTGEVEE